ncbi:MAG: hypothetical protein D6725_05005 [Planctomycetota bacterium]|nr:MAG: hypothetical protein D6725_05005 [Planctomycetota bacterium]
MNGSDFAPWVHEGKGTPPEVRWNTAVDGRLVALAMWREAGIVVAADETGTLTAFDRGGRVHELRRGWPNVSRLAWADAAGTGAVIQQRTLVTRLDAALRELWTIEFPTPVLDVALTPYGQLMAVSLEDRSVLLIGPQRQKIAEFDAAQPLHHLRFVPERPVMVGAADQGLLAAFGLDGTEYFRERLLTVVGDLCVTGDGGMIVIAGHNHGVQIFDENGQNIALYAVDGTVHRVATGYTGERLAAATLERQLYWADEDGQLIWATRVDQPVVALVADPLAEWLVCGLQDGTIVRLDW